MGNMMIDNNRFLTVPQKGYRWSCPALRVK